MITRPQPNLVRLPPTGGKLNGTNQSIVTTRPAIRSSNTRKVPFRVANPGL